LLADLPKPTDFKIEIFDSPEKAGEAGDWAELAELAGDGLSLRLGWRHPASRPVAVGHAALDAPGRLLSDTAGGGGRRV